MGQRQSSPEQPEEQQQQQQQPSNNSRERVIRPSSRTQVERINPIYINRNPPNMQYIPLNDSQRRAERRYRRSQLREQREQQRERQAFEAQQQQQQEREQERAQTHQEQAQHELTENPSGVTMTNITNTMNSYSSLSPFARMLAQVISEAVVASFRSGQIQFNASAFQGSDRQDDNRSIRQQLTMHLSPELFQQMEPESDENSFMRFMRLPVIISSIVSSNQSEGATPEDQGTSERVNSSQSTTSSTAATNNNNPSTTTTTSSTENSSNNQSSSPSSSTGLLNNDEVTRILMLPVFLYGIRSNHQLNLSSVLNDEDSSTSEQPVRRQSQRLRERQQREEDNNNNAEEETRNSNNSNDNNNTSNGNGNNGQWTVYIISGNSVENIMSERNPTYEELLDLASIIGPARRPTVSQEAIDSHVPIVKYTQQVKQNIIGNSEGCQVCLNAYQSEEDVRILACHHGFHKECIDKWLTEGQNQCPLCRNVPVPTNSSS
ncbi:hypothetical protein RMATCC62417_11979 [Rhizopus microsporus]|nr:hypothetical protein RMATCC62417_11979 [Rhizopus microsporus]